MATVPNCDQAVVKRRKVEGYLLSSVHPIGRAKALFFERFGFSAAVPDELSQALLGHVRENAIAVRYRVSVLECHS